jgi:hypothetical protein
VAEGPEAARPPPALDWLAADEADAAAGATYCLAVAGMRGRTIWLGYWAEWWMVTWAGLVLGPAARASLEETVMPIR